MKRMRTTGLDTRKYFCRIFNLYQTCIRARKTTELDTHKSSCFQDWTRTQEMSQKLNIHWYHDTNVKLRWKQDKTPRSVFYLYNELLKTVESWKDCSRRLFPVLPLSADAFLSIFPISLSYKILKKNQNKFKTCWKWGENARGHCGVTTVTNILPNMWWDSHHGR